MLDCWAHPWNTLERTLSFTKRFDWRHPNTTMDSETDDHDILHGIVKLKDRSIN